VVFSMIRLAPLVLLSALALQAQKKPIAFVDVALVSMEHEGVAEHQTVVVEDGRITAVGPSASTQLSKGTTEIYSAGKFLMPGLTDMHVHFVRAAIPDPSDKPASSGIPASASKDHERENRAYALMFLASGVTSVRNMWGSDTIDAFAKEIDSGRVDGPHIYSTGPITDGNPPVWTSSRIVETPAQAEEAVLADKQKGYVAIKVYGRLSKDAYDAIVAAARRHGLPVVGHAPASVGLEGAIAARQDSIEHLDGFLIALQPESRAAAQSKPLSERVRDADLKKLPAIVETIKAANIWICPTLVVNDLPRTDPAWLDEANLIPKDVFVRYQVMYPNKGKDPDGNSKLEALNLAILKGLHQGGAHLLLGTDTVKAGTLPGFSLHTELENFVAAGMTPYEAIRAGTADAAKFLHQENEFGVVATGRRADLLLVNANPLVDVKNTSNLAGVMVNGRWFSDEELTQQLSALRARNER
jgi:imidazolonepropionase-like amidohydrolase